MRTLFDRPTLPNSVKEGLVRIYYQAQQPCRNGAVLCSEEHKDDLTRYRAPCLSRVDLRRGGVSE